MKKRDYILTVFSENRVGLLNQICNVLICKSVNIETLTTSESALAGVHKFTISVQSTPEEIDLIAKQIEKKVDIMKVFVYTPDEVVMQEIALYKVSRGKSVERIIREHSVRILEVGDDYMVLERTGHTEDTQALLKLLQPYGVQQFVRSGLVAVIKAENEGVSNYLAERLRQKLAEEAAEAQKNNSN